MNEFKVVLPIEDMGSILVELEKTQMFKGKVGNNKYDGTWEWTIGYNIEYSSKLVKVMEDKDESKTGC